MKLTVSLLETGLHYLPNETGKDTWIVRGFYYHHLIKRLRIPIASSEDSERRSCFCLKKDLIVRKSNRAYFL
jgi:hypothetical protein